MIVGVGIDLVEVARVRDSIERHGRRLLERILGERELAALGARRGEGLAMHVAGRFAAKEALLKALGTGLRPGMLWRDVEVLARAPDGAPELHLAGLALQRAQELGADSMHVSITHSSTGAAAVVVLEARRP